MSDPVETLARARIEALAYRLWSIHPRDVPDPVGMPDRFPGGARAWIYANEISALVAEAVAQERAECAKVADAEGWPGSMSTYEYDALSRYQEGELDTGTRIAASIRGRGNVADSRA